MANDGLRAKLEARIVDLEYQVKHGKLDPKIALTALMEETVAECRAEIDILCFDSGDEWDRALRAAINYITIKD